MTPYSMMSIWKRFLLWGVIFAYFCRSYGGENGGNLCVETSVSRTFKHGKNKQPNADISFKEPQFASLEQSSAMRLETICMMKCLEEVHYLHKKLKNLDFKKILEEYVTHIDISKMFLLQSEIDDFTKRFASTLDVFLNGGSLTPGFSIFDLYRQKVRDRVRWIFQYIDRNQFDLYSDEIFIFDREKEDFVRHREALEKLWTNRLNFEIINEIVLKESAERRREQAIIDASSKEENRKIALFFREILYRYRLAKACRLEPQKPSKVHRPVPLNVGEVFAFNRSLLLPCYAVGNVYRLHFDGVDIKLPLTLEKKIERAKKNIKRRYQSLLNNVAQLEAWIVQEQFLNSVARVYDPHTAFMSHESMEDLRDMLHHSFVGIGAYLGDENGHCVVKELVPGGPAAKSKAIQIGDHIVAIAQENEDYVDTTGMLLNKITKLLRGAKGTRVFIKIQPVGDINELKTVPLIRDEIELMESRASGKIFNLPDGEREWRVGVIHLPGFYGESEKEVGNSDSMADMLALIGKLKRENMEGLVLDLRDNSGGLLEQSVMIGGLFMDGPIVQVRGQYGNVERFDTRANRIVWDGPLVVLVSKMSASAAEILAGALKDHNRAIIVGDQHTHGKGTVQILFPMEQLFSKFRYKESLGASRVTTQKWYRPSGLSTQIRGVESDIVYPSFDALLPVGESDLPHAIEWDSIDGLAINSCREITPEVFSQLKHLSQERQQKCPEFLLLNDRISRLKKVLEVKGGAIHLGKRRMEKYEDEVIQRTLDGRMQLLAKDNEPFKEILLDAVEIRNGERNAGKMQDSVEQKSERVDTHLKESLRVMVDFLRILR